MQRTIYSPSLSLLGLFVRMLITQFFIDKVRGTHCSLSRWDKLPSSTGMISADKLVPGNSKVSCSCKKLVALPVYKLGRWRWSGSFHNSVSITTSHPSLARHSLLLSLLALSNGHIQQDRELGFLFWAGLALTLPCISWPPAY